MRNNYHLERAAILATLHHMVSVAHLTIEDRPAITHAITNYARGIAFTDALHHASYQNCDRKI
ncbi:hypothetical protein GTP55_21245 [Duganella sp. FT109W]|uniref:Uncharacterized protein n=1 Tax=Duganella margarita TaxID=2692170 RepID=A0ABW9WLQ4_9BURK|nr:type II toxin-antitoxin system VapC family toxin [Duganella margarita]MYN41888.1 hypothetical protein [Duganella margarita]